MFLVTEAVWPVIRDLYAPWILPYDQRVMQQQCAQWIQQMNFDSASVLQPWIPPDNNLAMLFMNDFTDSILFLAETLPGMYEISYVRNLHVFGSRYF
jgi:hypothetical protein